MPLFSICREFCFNHVHAYKYFWINMSMLNHYAGKASSLGQSNTIMQAFEQDQYRTFFFQQLQRVLEELPQQPGFSAGPLEDDCKYLYTICCEICLVSNKLKHSMLHTDSAETSIQDSCTFENKWQSAI